MTNHKFLIHENCTKNNCLICDGGILVCIVCGGAEIELTEDCCERELTEDEKIKIAKKDIDFINGEWVKKRRLLWNRF